MGGVETKTIEELMRIPERIRNICIVAHIDHGKSTMTDSLLAGAGLLSEKIAGEARKTDFLEEEQKRGITIQATAVTMVHEYEGQLYLINLIDTPGHVDYGGEVTRAVRATDGAIVLVDAVEGVMPQTETVLRQALRERVKPVLFINKVDRLILELKLPPEKIKERIVKIIMGVNKLIEKYAPKDLKKEWQLRPEKGEVAFGSALHKWALSIPFMQKTGITFKDIYDAYIVEDEEEKKKRIEELAKKAPLHRVILDMVIKHLPNPKEAQKHRIPVIWRGDLESDVGKALLNCDQNGPTIFLVTRVMHDPTTGMEIAFGRVFSGTLKEKQELYILGSDRKEKVQRTMIVVIKDRYPVEEIPAGNTGAIMGIKGLKSGDTLSSVPTEPFEEIKHIFEPVLTKAFEPEDPKDLTRLMNVLTSLARQDTTLRVEINPETGEYLVTGLGPMHLEWIETWISKYLGIPVKTSNPIVKYRETVTKKSDVKQGRSPNKHNDFFIYVEPLDDCVYEKIRAGEIPEGYYRKPDERIIEKFVECGWERDIAKRVKAVFNGNVFIDATRGVVHIGEVIEMCVNAFKEMVKGGPLAKEPMAKVKVVMVDAKLHEDAIHRGPAQVIPAVRQAIRDAFLDANPILLEPVQKVRIDVPSEYSGEVLRLIQGKRGQVLGMDIDEEMGNTIIIAKVPVSESLDLLPSLRSVSMGKGILSLIDVTFEKLPEELQQKVIREIRQRKGLDVNAPYV